MTVQRLSDQQRLVLTALAHHQGVATPHRLAGDADRLALSWPGRQQGHTRQGVARTMASLIRRGLATRISHPKQVSYQITDAGKEAIRP